jgi:hypothetical protein
MTDIILDKSYGFMSKFPPLHKLSNAAFEPWESFLSRIHIRLSQKEARSDILQVIVYNRTYASFLTSDIEQLKLPEFRLDLVLTEREWQRTYMMMTFIANAYIYEDPESPSEVQSPLIEYSLLSKCKTLPSIVAVPLVKSADVIGINPVTTYASTTLYNWKLQDESAPLSFE